MKIQNLFLATLLLLTFTVKAQNLHDDANAAFPSNLLVADTNATTGWTSPGSSTINSIATTPFNGLYSLQLISTSVTDNDRVVEYTFDAIISETYNISIWVREGDVNNTSDDRPEFSNWTDLTGFSTTIITSGTTWTEYSFTVTATSTTPIIRIYAHSSFGTIGDSVDIDNVSIINTSADTTPPSTIADLSSTSVAETTLTLNWTDATDNVGVSRYGVFQDGTLIGEPITNTFDVTSLILGNSYDFTVYSIDVANNLSLVSNILNETTVDTIAPSAITDLSSASVTETTLTLNWTAATDNVAVTDYEVFQDAVSIGLTGGPNTLDVTSLTLGNSYDFTVFAKDAAGNTSLVSNTLNETTVDATAPSAITDLSSASVAETTLTLNWTAATDNVAVTDYEVFHTGFESLGLTGGSNTFNAIDLTPNTAYDFTVYAKDAVGNTSLISNTHNVSTLMDTTAPSAITDLSSASITETTLTLNWTDSTDNLAVTDYEVFQDAVSIGLTGGANTFDVTSLISATNYDFTVFAKDAAGNTSLVSNTLNETTIDITNPTSPGNLFTSDITAFTVQLNWTISQSLDVIGYRIYQVGVGLVDTVGNQTTYLFEELDQLTFYSFYVTAIDASNNESDQSNSVGFTTPEENGAIYYNNLNSNLISVDWTTKDLFALGNVGIGTAPDPNYKLAIDGNVVAEEVRVALKSNWPDYVFKKDYKLPTLIEVEQFIKQNGHLKNIPSASETELNGISIGEMNSKLLRKVEELTLYIIDQEKKINKLSEENKELKLLKDRILEIEKEINKIK
jgi:chitodextrinase